MRNQKKKSTRRSTASMAAQRMVVGSLPQEEDEVLQSPMQMVLHSFVRDKIAMAGVILFVFIFLCCVILPYFFPIDLYYQDVTQANVAPGFGMITVPSGLQGNAQDMSVGSSFSVGVDKDGNVYEWGTFPQRQAEENPQLQRDRQAGADLRRSGPRGGRE